LPIKDKLKKIVDVTKLPKTVNSEISGIKNDIGNKENYSNSKIEREISFFKKEENNIFNFYNITAQKDGQFDIRQMGEETLKLLLEKYENNKQKKQIFGAIKESFAPAFDYLEYFYKHKKDCVKVFCLFDEKTQAILNLSKYISKLYDKKERGKAQRAKHDLIQKYGDKGKTICNLYSKGYIPSMFSAYLEKLADNSELTEAKKVAEELLEKILIEAKSIFFISAQTITEEIIQEIQGYIFLKRPYIAIHSAGYTNNKKAKEIYTNTMKEAKINYKIENKDKKKKGMPFVNRQYLLN